MSDVQAAAAPARMTRLVLRAAERELMLWRRMWRGSIVTALVQPLMFLGAMGIGLGGLVDENTGDITTRSARGISYIEFITPGLMVAAAMLAMSGGALWGVMAGVKWMGQFRSMVHTAMTPGDIYGGLIAAAGVRGGVTAAAFCLMAALLGGVTSLWAPLAIGITMLTAAATVAALGAYSAGKQDDYTFPLIIRLVILPMFLFSGTFFPVEQLPNAIEPLAWLSPLFHASEPARMATTGSLDAWFLLHAGVLVAIIAVSLPIGIRRFTRRLTP